MSTTTHTNTLPFLPIQLCPRNGARVVARAWVDPSYKARLLNDAASAIAELGFTSHQGDHMIAVENTSKVHNLVVCTLCSCYPWPVLGLPPTWYKSTAYRARAVIDPRGVLQEFGTALPEDAEVRVWDSTAELRYILLPGRPAALMSRPKTAWSTQSERSRSLCSEHKIANKPIG